MAWQIEFQIEPVGFKIIKKNPLPGTEKGKGRR
jgi:hypothetical protein